MNGVIDILGRLSLTIAIGLVLFALGRWIWYYFQNNRESALIQDAAETSAAAVIARRSDARRSEDAVREQGAAHAGLLKLIADKLDAQTQALAHEAETKSKRHQEIIMRLEALVDVQEASVKGFKRTMEMMFGGPGYSAMDEETAALNERAEKLQKRYRLSRDEALAQAKASQVYESNSNDPAMRERV